MSLSRTRRIFRAGLLDVLTAWKRCAGPRRSLARLRLDRRLVYQHNRDVVLDGIHTMARPALERRAVLDEGDRRLAVGAGEDFEQFCVDWHITPRGSRPARELAGVPRP